MRIIEEEYSEHGGLYYRVTELDNGLFYHEVYYRNGNLLYTQHVDSNEGILEYVGYFRYYYEDRVLVNKYYL